MDARKAANRDRRHARERGREALKTVVLAVSRAVVRTSLAESLSAVPEIRLGAVAPDEATARAAARHHDADTVVLDLFADDRLNDAAAISLLAELPRLHVVILGHGPEWSGTTTVLAASATLDDLVRVIVRGPDPDRAAADGPAGTPTALQLLSRSERRVAALVAKGLPNRTIAVLLHLSEKTVRNYVSNILGKLGFANRTQLAARIASGQLDLSEEA